MASALSARPVRATPRLAERGRGQEVLRARPRPDQPETKRRRWPISLALALTFGGLVLAATGLVAVVLGSVAGSTTEQLIITRSHAMVGELELRLDRYVDEPQAQLASLAELIESGAAPPGDLDAIGRLAASLLASTMTRTVLAFVRADGEGVAVWRDEADAAVELVRFALPNGRDARAYFDDLRTGGAAAGWGLPFVAGELGSALPLGRTVIVNDRRAGYAQALVTVRALSQDLAGLPAEWEWDLQPFILYAGNRVLAHPLLGADAGGKEAEPLVPVGRFADPVLRALHASTDDGVSLGDVHLREVEVGGVRYVGIVKRASVDEPIPVIFGVYVDRASMATEWDRLVVGMAVSVTSVLVAVVIAILFGRLFANSIMRLAAAAAGAGRLDFDDLQRLPASLIREIDDASNDFRAMGHALEAAARFLPRRLVLQLLQPEDSRPPFATRELTILFTDLGGFTTISEHLSADATARLLNAHLDLVASAIEAEEGTVDKFLGDGAMAFWGAPDAQADHAARALRAAAAIGERFLATNAGAEPPLRLRIGVHTGAVVVGEIGGGSRVNYTIVGDAVNTASRLCELGKEVAPGAELVALVSEATLDAAAGAFPLVERGTVAVRGRAMPLKIWELAPWR